MTVELEMMNEENGRLRRHIKTLEAELRKQDAAQAQAPDCGCIGPRECTGECCKKAAVGPFAWVTKIGILLPPYEPMHDDVPLYTSPPDHTKAMRLALEALNNSIDLVWEEYTEAERNYGDYPTRRARLDGMKAMAQQHTDAIAAIKGALK
ncbi:MAG: hypothetical protein K9K35_11875 [Rhodoferax sp.]|nr:hypothetical protein [Rhodoferax sp.]